MKQLDLFKTKYLSIDENQNGLTPKMWTNS